MNPHVYKDKPDLLIACGLIRVLQAAASFIESEMDDESWMLVQNLWTYSTVELFGPSEFGFQQSYRLQYVLGSIYERLQRGIPPSSTISAHRLRRAIVGALLFMAETVQYQSYSHANLKLVFRYAAECLTLAKGPAYKKENKHYIERIFLETIENAQV